MNHDTPNVRRHGARPLCVAALLTIALAGCERVPGIQSTAANTPGWEERHLHIAPRLLRTGFRDLQITTHPRASGLLQMHGHYVNRSDTKLNVLYRVTWLDEAGQPIGDTPPDWRASQALAHTRGHLSATAPNKSAREIQIELIDARTRP